jgi:hypothetical protein
MTMTPEDYVSSVDLTGTPRLLVDQNADFQGDTQVYDEARKQAQVVGSGVFSFAPGVNAATREAISDALLLAQLVANKQSNAADQPVVWFAEHVKILQKLGWVTADGGWTDYTAAGVAADVHHEILAVLAAVLGPAPAALAILTATVEALKAMDAASPWIRIFSRESQKANIARFQLGAVEASGDAVSMSMLACLIEASSSITQVLFFKVGEAKASFKANHTRVSTGGGALRQLHPKIRAKIDVYQDAYLSSIVNL